MVRSVVCLSLWVAMAFARAQDPPLDFPAYASFQTHVGGTTTIVAESPMPEFSSDYQHVSSSLLVDSFTNDTVSRFDSAVKAHVTSRVLPGCRFRGALAEAQTGRSDTPRKSGFRMPGSSEHCAGFLSHGVTELVGDRASVLDERW